MSEWDEGGLERKLLVELATDVSQMRRVVGELPDEVTRVREAIQALQRLANAAGTCIAIGVTAIFLLMVWQVATK